MQFLGKMAPIAALHITRSQRLLPQAGLELFVDPELYQGINGYVTHESLLFGS